MFAIGFVSKNDHDKRGMLLHSYSEKEATEIVELRNRTFSDEVHFLIKLPKMPKQKTKSAMM